MTARDRAVTAPGASDLDLLELQCRWRAGGTAPAGPGVTFLGVHVLRGVGGRWRVLPGSTLPPEVRRRVEEVLASERPGHAPSADLREAVRAACVDGSAPAVEGGPVFVMDGPVRAPSPPPAGTRVVTSADPRRPPDLSCPRSWDSGEWDDLLGGRLGPWAAVIVDDGVASLTHTPRPLLEDAAECGTWTDPAHRGRGLAAIATAAWAGLVDRPGRKRFYSTDHRNRASQRVAERLGFRLVGWQWRISAAPWTIGDAWGDALRSHHRARWTPTPELEVEGRPGAVGAAMHPEWFFRTFERWDWWDRELLPLARRSPTLDLGAGAGRASLWLQEQGVAVTSVDSSAGAVEVCRARGVADARIGNLLDPPTDRRWQAILLLCGNLGLGGSYEGTRRLLRRLAEVSADDAVLVGDTVDPGDDEPDVGLRIRYGHVATAWWRQRNLPIAEVAAVVEGTGWVVDRHLVDRPDHAVLLRKTRA